MEKPASTIKDLPERERPRERLLAYGPSSLSNADLIAIILRTGTSKVSAIHLAENLLAKFGSLKGVATADPEEMQSVDGMGQAKAAQISAAMELGRRLASFTEDTKPIVSEPSDVVRIVMPELRDEKKEHFKALYLDVKNRILRQKTIFVGTLDGASVHPREVFREAVSLACANIIIAHNHPSGDPTPSSDDKAVTLRFVEAGKVVGIEILDHIVVGDGRWVSFKKAGLL